MEGSSSSNPGNPYPYPSHVCGPNIVTMKLSGQDTYDVWKTQMLCLLESHDMLDFIKCLGKETVGDNNYKLWRRSDAVVRGWILGSLSEQTLVSLVKTIKLDLVKTNKSDFTSKDVWDKLKTTYGPPDQDAAADYDEKRIRRKTSLQETEEEKKLRKEEEYKEKAAGALYRFILDQNFPGVERIFSKNVITWRDEITINGNTALHVAVGTSNNREFLEKMLKWATKDKQPLDMKNSDGSTVLHVAAIVGNTKAARMLVENKHNYLLNLKDKEGQTAVARALFNMHMETYIYLLDTYFRTQDRNNGHVLFDNYGGCEILANIISSEDYGSASSLVYDHIDKFLSHIDYVLMAIAQNFPRKLNFWERTVYICMPGEFKFLDYQFVTQRKFKFVQALERREKNYVHAKDLLKFICLSMRLERLSRPVHHYYNNAILEATRQNAYEIVKIIVSEFPNAIWSSNEDGHNIIQYAVINRSEKVYNLLYQMSEHKNIYRTIKDRFGNNLLHLAARLAPTNKLNHISGAALQLQFELQWYKEVERFVCPLNVIQKNWFGETPQVVFTREHKDMVTDGEKWMKETAQSFTITAALIITIVFAAAITVPGGNIQDKEDMGMPVFAKKTAFKIFAAADAIALLTSVTSLLMFLSILTARFSEQDFLYKLPTKLILGLTTLFISTAAMILAFGATLFLVLSENNQHSIIAPIATFTCLPIFIFLTLQLPLIKDLVGSTCFRGNTFGKKSDDPFY